MIVADTGSWQTSDQFYRMTKEETQRARRGSSGMIPARIAGEDPRIFIDKELGKFENDPAMRGYVAWLRARKEELQ